MSITAPNTLADEIRSARVAASLTQDQLADLAGVSVWSIRSWEQGTGVPQNSLALRIVREVLARQNDDGAPRNKGAAVQESTERGRRGAG